MQAEEVRTLIDRSLMYLAETNLKRILINEYLLVYCIIGTGLCPQTAINYLDIPLVRQRRVFSSKI